MTKPRSRPRRDGSPELFEAERSVAGSPLAVSARAAFAGGTVRTVRPLARRGSPVRTPRVAPHRRRALRRRDRRPRTQRRRRGRPRPWIDVVGREVSLVAISVVSLRLPSPPLPHRRSHPSAGWVAPRVADDRRRAFERREAPPSSRSVPRPQALPLAQQFHHPCEQLLEPRVLLRVQLLQLASKLVDPPTKVDSSSRRNTAARTRGSAPFDSVGSTARALAAAATFGSSAPASRPHRSPESRRADADQGGPRCRRSHVIVG